MIRTILAKIWEKKKIQKWLKRNRGIIISHVTWEVCGSIKKKIEYESYRLTLQWGFQLQTVTYISRFDSQGYSRKKPGVYARKYTLQLCLRNREYMEFFKKIRKVYGGFTPYIPSATSLYVFDYPLAISHYGFHILTNSIYTQGLAVFCFRNLLLLECI